MRPKRMNHQRRHGGVARGPCQGQPAQKASALATATAGQGVRQLHESVIDGIDAPQPCRERQYQPDAEHELLERNREGAITAGEQAKLKELVAEAEQLMAENAKRLAAFQQETAEVPAGAIPVTVWVKPAPAGY